MSKVRVLFACGYFDWFSGYQEVGLARAMADLAETHVLAGNRVNPIFSDSHLHELGLSRTYRPGTTEENGVAVHRISVRERRSMLWGRGSVGAVRSTSPDVIIQVMPGQVLPMAATVSGVAARRAVLFGDNAAMYAQLSPLMRELKRLVFLGTKGMLYSAAMRRSERVYGYTPDTIERLRSVPFGRSMELLPLVYDDRVFFHDHTLRAKERDSLGYTDSDRVVIVAGKLQPQKQLEAVLDALRRVRDPNVRLLVVGADDSPYVKKFRSITADDPYLAARVRIMPFVGPERLNSLFNAADVGIWPAMPAITIQQSLGTGLRVILPRNTLVGHLLVEGAGTYLSDEGGLSERVASALEPMLLGQDSAHERALRSTANNWLSSSVTSARLLADLGV